MRINTALMMMLLVGALALALAPGDATALQELTDVEMDGMTAGANPQWSSMAGNIGSGPEPILQNCGRYCRASGNIGFAINQACTNNCKASGNIGQVNAQTQRIGIVIR